MIDFSKSSPKELVATAGKYGWVLSDIFHACSYRHHVHFEAYSSTGQWLEYDGLQDYKLPHFRDFVTAVIPPRACTLLQAARGLPCESVVRKELGGERIIDWVISGEVYDQLPKPMPPIKEMTFSLVRCRLRYPL